jgi:hypothetical protein
MKNFMINGEPQNFATDAVDFGEFIQHINRDYCQKKKVISSIKIDGKELTESDESFLEKMPLSSIDTIEVDIANPADLTGSALDTLTLYVDRLIETLQKSAKSYSEKNLIAGDHFFAKSVDSLDLFIQTVSAIKVSVGIKLNTKVAIAEASLVSTVNDLLTAKRQNNLVFLAELLEKDLVENLNEWKFEVFPILRSFNS